MTGGSIALPAIVGREAELEQIRQLFELDGPAGLVIEGEAGIGKTTLWLHGVEEARRRGTVLVARPAEGEASLPFSALGDLLEPVLDSAVPGLPAPQRAALETALLRVQPTEEYGRLAVSRAVLTLLRGVALREPTVLAIDDVQWLDPASADVLEFAVRRLGELPVRFLVARRSTHALPAPLGLERALGPGRVETLRIGPLPVGDLDRLLRANLNLRLPRPRLLELHRRAGGNPFYALEIARASARSGADDLLVPESLGALLRDRLDALPPVAREVILLVAASLNPATRAVERAAGGSEGLAEAVHQEVLVLDGERIRFSHPLLASVSYESAPPWERRAIHSRLAAAAADSEERAVHLARGQETPDEAIAAELEDAARAAAVRGGPGLAAELAEAAARLTPIEDPAGRRRRLMSAPAYHEAEGDPARGRELLEQLIAGMEPGPERAALLSQLANMSEDSLEESIRLCEQALAEAEGDPSLIAEIHTLLSALTWIVGDLERSLEHSRASVRYAEEAGDEVRLAIAIGDACNSEALLALPWDREAMARALEIEQRVEELPPWLRPSYQLAVISIVTDELETARPLVTAELERARSLGNEPGVFHLLLRVVDLELRAGRWSQALRAAREAHALARQGGLDLEEAMTGTALALVLAHLGELEEARSLAEPAYRVSDDLGHRGLAIRSAGVLGLVELQAADAERALVWLTPAREELERMGMGELSISGVVQNEIEALVACGRLDEADGVIAYVSRAGARAGRAWHRAVAERGRALVASARGDFDKAREHLDRALSAHERLPQPFELGRTLLAQGTIERRAKHRGAARLALTGALELFDELGAPLWAEKAAAELARIPGRAPAAGELSETERRVAGLVASGLANKEVAAKLFVTVRTVEGNLTRIYAKLGVRSRTELAALLGRDASTPPS